MTMNTMDFIKHDETPLFLLIAHLTAASKIEAPEVLTDVALLCEEKNHNLQQEVNIKQISYI